MSSWLPPARPRRPVLSLLLSHSHFYCSCSILATTPTPTPTRGGSLKSPKGQEGGARWAWLLRQMLSPKRVKELVLLA